MKKQQQATINKILADEQITISKLAENVEINRSTLSKLVNHNEQLTEDNWNKLKEAYPEHVVIIESEENFNKFIKARKTNTEQKQIPGIKVKVFDQDKNEKDNGIIRASISVDSTLHPKIATTISEINEDLDKTVKKTILEDCYEPLQKTHDELLEQTNKQIKTKEAARHRNLNCPESNYHMKVQKKDLLRGRPFCPLTGLPMMLKEEIKKYKSMDEKQRKAYTTNLSATINLFDK